MNADGPTPLVTDTDAATALEREGPWIAIGKDADRTLACQPTARSVLLARSIHGALELLAETTVAGCLVQAKHVDDRPRAALKQLRRALGFAPLVVLGPVRRAATRDAAREASIPILDGTSEPETAPRVAAPVPEPEDTPPTRRKKRGHGGRHFADGCLARVAKPSSLRAFVLDAFVDRSGATRASLMLRERGRHTLRLATVRGWPSNRLVGKVRQMIGSGIAGRGAAIGRPVAGHGARDGARGYAGSAYVVIPLGVGRQCQGVVSLTALPGDELPSNETLRDWSRLGRSAGLALRHARKLRRLSRLSAHDSGTGLPNRRSFERALRRELERARRAGGGVAVAVLDIDHFKRVNDELGHAVGDKVLAEVARRLQTAFRETDLVCRWGGEEFAVLLPGVSPHDSTEVAVAAERARRAVADQPIQIGAGIPPRVVTISGGLATWPTDAPDGPALVNAADTALYDAKQGGRNRVCRS